MIYLVSFVMSFVAVFLKGFQYKNVIGGHMRLVIVTAFLMAFLDVALVFLVVKGDWTLGFSAGCGASSAMYLSIRLHDAIYGAKHGRDDNRRPND